MKQHNLIFKIIIWLVLILLLLPFIATLMYSLTTSWQTTILPENFTFQNYIYLFTNQSFLLATLRTLLISIICLAIAFFITVPAIFITHYYHPKLDIVFKTLAITPFAIPPIVLSVGILKIYSGSPFYLSGNMILIVGVYLLITIPFTYRTLKNSLDSLAVRDLMESANILGANDFKAFFKVVLPNLKQALIIACFLNFSFLAGEFVFINFIIGSRFETLQLYLFDLKTQSSHITSAVVVIFFVLIFITTSLGLKALNKKR